MPEIARLTGISKGFELAFGQREATPKPLVKLSIHLHTAGVSLSDTVFVLDRSGVDRCRSPVDNWMRKADLQPEAGTSPTHAALDQRVIHLTNERYRLLPAVDPKTNERLHLRLHPACTIALTERFLDKRREKHDVADVLFLVAGAPWLQAALHRDRRRFQHATHGNRNAVERVFNEVRRRTNHL